MLYLTEFFKLISDETRLRIVILLAQEDLYVCQMCGIMNLSQPKISKHLTKLRELNYVNTERREKYIMYSLKKQDDVIKKLIQNILENMHQYPILEKDRKSLKNKDIYFSSCKTICIESMEQGGNNENN